MNDQLTELGETIKNTTCSVCNRVLSVPPVFIISGDQENLKNRCGRCKNAHSRMLIRNTTFENAAKFLSFPCIYKRCKEQIPWKYVRDHETACPFRTIRCPSYDDCSLDIEVTTLGAHFKEVHRNNIRHERIQMPCFLLCDDVYLLLVKNQQYLVRLMNRSDVFYVYVSSLHDYGEHVYEVELASDAVPGMSVSLINSNIYKYDENKYCLNCECSRCNLPSHENKILNVIPGCSIKKSAVSSLLQIPSGDRCTVTVSVKKTPADIKMATSKAERERNDRLRASFECPICNEYMASEIFICKIGHTICGTCKAMVKSCPTCRSDISTRNYILEDVAKLVDLTCANEDVGCDFVGSLIDIVKHEVDCLT